jgi:DNA polymerase III subunit epsilon
MALTTSRFYQWVPSSSRILLLGFNHVIKPQMKLKSKFVPTEEQKETIKDDMTRWAKERLADHNTLILDLETTGILSQDPDTEIVEISIVNTAGRPVLSMLVNPGRPIPLAAQKIHRIDDRMVLGLPTLSDVGPLVVELIRGKHVVAYNAGFDIHTLVYLLGKHGIEVPEFNTSCAMEAYSAWCGEWMSHKADWRWQKLPKLAYGSSHDSLVDCVSTLMLMRRMAGDFSDEPDVSSIDLDF